MADVKSADPEDDVFGNVGSVVGDALEVTRGENELHAGAHQLGLLSHVLEQLLENAVAVLTHDIVAFENLRGHLEVPENQGAKTLADHGAYGGGHGSQLFGNLRALQFTERNDAFGEVHRDVADAFEIIGDLQSGDDEAHLVVRERAAAEQPDGVFIDDNFIERAVHGAFDSARHGNEIVHQRVIEHHFGESGSCCHVSPPGGEDGKSHSPAYAKFCAANGYSLFRQL